MGIAVISDTLFGDEHCALVSSHREQTPAVGPGYQALKHSIGRVDYLILVGDIFDFSVTSYENAYKQAKLFFKKVQEQNLTKWETKNSPSNRMKPRWRVHSGLPLGQGALDSVAQLVPERVDPLVSTVRPPSVQAG